MDSSDHSDEGSVEVTQGAPMFSGLTAPRAFGLAMRHLMLPSSLPEIRAVDAAETLAAWARRFHLDADGMSNFDSKSLKGKRNLCLLYTS